MSATDHISLFDGHVVVADPSPQSRRSLRCLLEAEGINVCEVDHEQTLWSLLHGYDPLVGAVLLDLDLGASLAVLEKLVSDRDTGCPTIVLGDRPSVDDAIRAVRLGAVDVIQKPVERSRLVSSVGKALRRAAAQSHLREVRKRIRGELVGCSDAIESLLAQIAKVGPTAARVLICGESGTGKELVARAIHHASELSHQPFVRVNCAAIPRELIESELFGHERGAFTGAVGQKKGLFEAADGGTIFLDEIGDMALGVQAKVLRVLQSGEFMRVGGDRLVKVNVRVLAATHRDLRRAVELGSFREDLYFRLAVVPVTVPPLRDRKEDIELLTHHFIELACSQNRMPVKLITEGVLEALRRHDWPGNVRELRNVVERMVILSEGELTPQDIPVEISTVREPIAVPSLVVAEPPLDVSLRDYRDAVERELILRRLHALSWNVSRTAVSLGIERTYLHRKMKNLKIFR